MNLGFWPSLRDPIFALAPMHDVTDAAFRRLVAEIAKPDVLFTEFAAVDGLTHEKSREKMIRHYLGFSEIERPIVAQLWGNNPDHFYTSAQLIEKLGFDGVDINMGCPDKKVVSLGGGAALIQDPARAIEIIQAVKEATQLPVSIKTRLGFNTVDFSFIQKIAAVKPVAITIHARTKKELSLVPAHWNDIARVVPELHKQGIIVLGNGDVKTRQEVLQRVEETGVDGVMIGRGVFGNPWIFSDKEREISLKEKLAALLRHAELFENIFGESKNFSVIKKHVHGYIHGFDGAKEMRNKLVQAKKLNEMQKILKNLLY